MSALALRLLWRVDDYLLNNLKMCDTCTKVRCYRNTNLTKAWLIVAPAVRLLAQPAFRRLREAN